MGAAASGPLAPTDAAVTDREVKHEAAVAVVDVEAEAKDDDDDEAAAAAALAPAEARGPPGPVVDEEAGPAAAAPSTTLAFITGECTRSLAALLLGYAVALVAATLFASHVQVEGGVPSPKEGDQDLVVFNLVRLLGYRVGV